jgi:hypothetical protein
MSTIAIAILVLLAFGSASGYLSFHGDLVLAEAKPPRQAVAWQCARSYLSAAAGGAQVWG